jgi:hypothetical protein
MPRKHENHNLIFQNELKEKAVVAIEEQKSEFF